MRKIVREAGFEAELVGLVGSIKEADDFVMAAELVLAMSPHIGMRAACRFGGLGSANGTP